MGHLDEWSDDTSPSALTLARSACRFSGVSFNIFDSCGSGMTRLPTLAASLIPAWICSLNTSLETSTGRAPLPFGFGEGMVGLRCVGRSSRGLGFSCFKADRREIRRAWLAMSCRSCELVFL